MKIALSRIQKLISGRKGVNVFIGDFKVKYQTETLKHEKPLH
jgi:hypothetical protein